MGSNSAGPGTPKFGGPPRKRARLLYARRVGLFAALVALPGFILTVILLWLQPWGIEAKLTLFFLALFVWWMLALALQENATRPLQTLANVVAALREEEPAAFHELTNLFGDVLLEPGHVRVAKSFGRRRVFLQKVDEPRRVAIGEIELVELAGEVLMVQMQPVVLREVAALDLMPG